MLDLNSKAVQFKLAFLSRALRGAEDAIVFGDIYFVEGGYSVKCLEFGCKRVTLVDVIETRGWLNERLKNKELNFYKGDFSSTLFMKSIPEQYDVSVAFDVLLHQPPLINTLQLMLEKTKRRICIVQPMLVEFKTPNVLVYLPGCGDADLHPTKKDVGDVNIFDVMQVNQSYWIWGMTPSFMKSVLKGSGFDVVYEDVIHANDERFLTNKKWFRWGCIAERKTVATGHWANCSPQRDIIEPNW